MTRTLSFVALILALGGCSAGEPPYKEPTDGPVLIYQDAGPEDLSCSEQTPLAPPQVVNLPASTDQLMQPVRGYAPGAEFILARSGAGESRPVPVGLDGRFCIEVALIPNQENQISLTAISEGAGCRGQEQVVTNHSAAGRGSAAVATRANDANEFDGDECGNRRSD